MNQCLASPRDPIVNICTESRRRSAGPRAAWDDDEDDADFEEFNTPLPDDDPDWGFDNDEAEPEEGDFWFDDDEEEAL